MRLSNVKVFRLLLGMFLLISAIMNFTMGAPRPLISPERWKEIEKK